MLLKNTKVLITCGPTWVPIDKVRVISNKSTGELGHTIAKNLVQEGAKVTLLEGPVTHSLKFGKIRTLKFWYFDELYSLLKQELKKKFDIIIQAAAVADYQLQRTYIKKISSGISPLKLDLVPTPKIINRIKRWAPQALLVGFKLELTQNKKKLVRQAFELIKKAKCDLVIANYFSNQVYHGLIIDREKNILAIGKSRQDISRKLIKILRKKP